MSVTANQTKRVALSGYYGCGNLGDEAVLAGIRDAFRRCAGDRVELTALSQNPEATKALHGINAQPRMDLKAVRRTIASSDLLISGGGSLLQDTTSLKSLLYYLYIIRIATSRRVPFMLYAQGIGPLNRPISRKLVSLVVNKAACITVRDPGSEKLLRSIGVNRPTIQVTADPAFALQPAAASAVEPMLQGITNLSDYLGVALRPWGDAAASPIQRYGKLLTELEAKTGKRCLLVPMHHPDDVSFAKRVSDECGAQYAMLEGEFSPDMLLGVVSQLSGMVAMRLHSLIFAARVGIPMFALSYDPKVQQLMQILDQSDSLADWREFDPTAVASQFAELLKAHGGGGDSLKAKAAEREDAALSNCRAALSILGIKSSS